MSALGRLPIILEEIEKDLNRTVQFWLQHSSDEKYGGYQTCLGPDGSVYDETKYTWLQCRQVWMYAKLFNEHEKYNTQEILNAALKGAEFIQQHAIVDPDSSKCSLIMARDGRPIKVQRTIFSECFYLMAMSEMARATRQRKYYDEAAQMMEKIVYWVKEDDAQLGDIQLSGSAHCSKLANPMMLLCVLNQLESTDPGLAATYKNTADWCVKQLFNHSQRDGSVVLEHVAMTGEELPGSAGRLMVPGHAIEAGWFLLQRGMKTNDRALQSSAIDKFILPSFSAGWDKEHGGLLYFLDADGWSPTQLEWDMKLWWPHNEAMIAFLMAYQATGDAQHLDRFAQVYDYSQAHFVDRKDGDWFGYLNRRGEISLYFKGGPWKGFFHVPRYQLMCRQILLNILN